MSSEPPSASRRPAPPRPPEPLVALAGTLRELIETLLRVERLPEPVAAEVDAARRRLEALHGRLRPLAADDREPHFGEGSVSRRPYYVQGARVGDHHPGQILYELRHEDGTSRGRVRFGVTHEGPPGCVHGGWIAYFFDEILGGHNLACAIPAMTGSLTVRYRRPTPILTDLDFHVESEVSGRKVRTRGRLELDGEVVAEGDGLFVAPRGADWLAARAGGAGPATDPDPVG